jgi:hypothetical protein
VVGRAGRQEESEVVFCLRDVISSPVLIL